jgi:hypothetical protein
MAVLSVKGVPNGTPLHDSVPPNLFSDFANVLFAIVFFSFLQLGIAPKLP